MTYSNGPTDAPPPSLVKDLLGLARYYLGGRRAILVLASLAVVAGMALNWGWLTAIGVAPVLVGLLPCAAMCALGLCMNRAGDQTCSTGKSSRDDATNDSTTVPGEPPSMAVHQIPTSPTAVSVADAKRHPPKERNTIDA